jgi:MarR family transcriptional regulator, repressor for mepA
MKENNTKSVPRLIMGIGHHLKMRIDEKLSQNNLTVSQFKVLAFLWQHNNEKINQKQIHEFLEIKPSSMTKLIRLLQGKKLIKKEIDPDDSRNKIIKLTEKGMDIKRICLQNMKQSESYLLDDFTQQEIDTLIYLLLKIKKRIKN